MERRGSGNVSESVRSAHVICQSVLSVCTMNTGNATRVIYPTPPQATHISIRDRLRTAIGHVRRGYTGHRNVPNVC